MIKLKDLLKEELYNSQGEGYTFGKGDIVKDINPDCPHHNAEGEVIKGGKVKITFRVTNNGKNYKEGDELEKTTDQMVKLNSVDVNEGKLNELTKFKPFQVKRSLGAGIRSFMPMFGLLGIDFAHGFDNIPNSSVKSGWQTHFIIGQQF